MRTLFVTYAERTHYFAMAPLAWALRTAGHDVCFASQPAFVDELTQAGLTAVAVGRYSDPARMLELAPDFSGSDRAGPPMPYDVSEQRPEDVSWDYLKNGFAHQVRHWHKVVNVPMVPDLVDFARHWRPDLVVWEPTTFAGAVAAKACGAVHARLMFGLDIYGVTRDHYLRLKAGQPREDRADPLAEWLAGYGRKYGFEFSEDMVTGQFTIDQFPDSIQTRADLHYLPMRYTPYGGPAVVPSWLWVRPERPRVAMTFGLSATERFDGYVVSVQDILDALADLDIELVATVSKDEQEKLVRIPDNARVVPYVPLHDLVTTCAAVIHHAGFGTLSTIALHALPQLLIPSHSDEPALARELAEQGVAITMSAGEATGQAVREGLLRLLGDPAFRRNAARLRAEMLALATPHELVGHLERLVAEHHETATSSR